ncbi:MAG TPA: RNA polymerase subunit sigma [Planctomycetaceae bacterium]|nr:RNA polymerase subunit sigma [Planctomycetaceae bacterium]
MEFADDKTALILKRAKEGDASARSDLVALYRDRIKRMVSLRMDRRLQSRVDASDIVQDASLEATKRLDEYFAKTDSMDFFVWLRWLAIDKLLDTHRFHLGAQKRRADQEVSIYSRPVAEATSIALAEHLLGRVTQPSESIQKRELQVALEEALNDLDPVDREVLVLRHFEDLSNNETAAVLGIKKSGASRRYVVALARLRELMQDNPAFSDYFA